MAFKRSAVRSRLSPPKVLKTIGFQHFFLFLRTFQGIFRPLELRSNLKHSRGVVMARISMRNVQKSSVSEYFDLYLSSAAARGVKDKTLQTYKNHFRSISKRMDVTVPMNRLNSQDLKDMILSMREEGLSASSINSYTRTLKVFFSWCNEEGHFFLNICYEYAVRFECLHQIARLVQCYQQNQQFR